MHIIRSPHPHKAFPLKSEGCNLLDHFLKCQSVNYCQFRKTTSRSLGGNVHPVFDQTKTLLWTIWNDYKITSPVLGLPNDCQTLRSNKGSVKAFRLPSMKRNKPGECLFGEYLDGWMRRGFKISHWKFLGIIFFGVKGTPSSIFFFWGRRGKEAGCNCRWSVLFSATFRDLRCRILRWSGGALREKRQIQLVGWWCSRTGKLAAANVSFLTLLLREDIDGHIVDLPLTQ